MLNAKCWMLNDLCTLAFSSVCWISFAADRPPLVSVFPQIQFCIHNSAFCILFMYPENWTLLSVCNRVWQHWACFRSSFRLISISQLNTLLRLHLWPINDIVYVEPQWRSYLRGSFTLRCLQRLSRPHVATQPCPWQNNWYTRGASIPVLSY